jgi:hypothetical protein
MAMHFAIAQLAPEHLRETRERRLVEIDRVEGEVRARLKREISYWDGRAEELALKEQAGKGGRLNSSNARAYAQTLTERLDRRLRQLTEERDIQALSGDKTYWSGFGVLLGTKSRTTGGTRRPALS